MRVFSIGLAVVVMFSIMGDSFGGEDTRPGVGGSAFHKNDITYSVEVQTPHVKWATRLPGGPIKGFFTPSIRYGRDMVELMQRLELRPTTVSIDRDWDTNCWGIGDYYGHGFRGDRYDYEQVYKYVESDLAGEAEFEVMVIPEIAGWSRMTRKTRDAILKRVQDGAGLVLIRPQVGDVAGVPYKGDEAEGDIRIWDISPLVECGDDPINDGGYVQIDRNPAMTRGKWKIVKPHFITRGVPGKLLPAVTIGAPFNKYKANGEVLVEAGDGHPLLAVRRYGAGRVVALAYHNQGFIPLGVDAIETGVYWDYWEYYYSLMARAIMWAAGREGGIGIESMEAGETIEPNIKLTVSSAVKADVEVEVLAKSEFGESMGGLREDFELKPGRNELVIGAEAAEAEAADGVIGGKVIYDVIIREGGATLDWGTVVREWPKRAVLRELSASAEVYKRGQTLSAEVRAEGELVGLELVFKVRDEFDRLIAQERAPAAEETVMTCGLSDYVGHYAFMTAELVSEAGHVVDQLRANGVLVVQEKRRPKEFKALVSFAGGRGFFRNLRGRLVHAAGAEPGFVWGGAVNTGLNIPKGTFGVYWYHRGPFDEEGIEKLVAEYEEGGDFDELLYNVKKELYKRTGDKEFLARRPCFHDEEFMKSLVDTVERTAAAKARYNFDYYFVGDEGSLTSYTDDLGFCFDARTLAALRRWLLREYGSLDALNHEWGTQFQKWDEVVPDTSAEALRGGRFASWADHRTFMEVTFAKAYEAVREAVVRGDGEGHVALSGTQVTKAYNGCDWYRLDGIIDDFLSYSGGNQWDIHRSFAKPGSMIGYWTGYGSRGMGVQNAIWTAAVHGVLHPNIFWMYSYLDPDFTLSESARDMGEAFKALKFEGVGKLMMEAERLGDGVALHYSMPSVHAASITFNDRERSRTPDEVKRDFSADRDGWVRTLKDVGLQFDFVSYDEVERGKLVSGGYRVFVMPFTMALSAEEVAGIKAFAEAGGVVIADAAAGVMNEHCSWREEGLLNEFFGIRAADSSKRDYSGETGEVSVTFEGERWGLSAGKLPGLEAAEKGLTVSDGKALGRVGETPVAVVRRVGKGWAVYLNVLYDGYSRQRRRDFGGAAYRRLAGGILRRLGIRRGVEIVEADGRPLEQAVVVRYAMGNSRVLAVVKENVGLEGITGRDGVTVYDDARGWKVAEQEITIRLPKAYYISDVRSGRQLGYSEVVRATITVGGALVLALSPVENALRLWGPEEAGRGEHVRFGIESKAGGKRIVRCHFHSPDGAFVPHYAANVVVESGMGEVILPSALNDAAGVWRLDATDILTGAKTKAEVSLR